MVYMGWNTQTLRYMDVEMGSTDVGMGQVDVRMGQVDVGMHRHRDGTHGQGEAPT